MCHFFKKKNKVAFKGHITLVPAHGRKQGDHELKANLIDIARSDLKKYQLIKAIKINCES